MINSFFHNLVNWPKMNKFYILGVLLLAAPTVIVSINPSDGTASDEIDIFKNIIPIHYELFLQRSAGAYSYEHSGRVKILIEITENVQLIKIHAKDLTIMTKPSVTRETDKASLEINDYHNARRQEVVVIEMSELVPPGKYELSLQFKKYFFDEKIWKGETDKLIYTPRTKNNARSLFPCFDEPSMRATFSVEIQMEKHFENLLLASGIKESATRDYNSIDSCDRYVFAETVPMSPYQIALVATNYQSRSITVPQNGYGKPFKLSIYMDNSNLNSTDFYLLFAKEFMEYMTAYTGVPYPLPELNLVGYSRLYGGDFVNSFGLIMIEEECLNTRNMFTKCPREKAVYELAMKLSQQWFTNIVTVKSWSDANFLNGLSSFIVQKGLEHIKPTWNDVNINWFFHEKVYKILLTEEPDDILRMFSKAKNVEVLTLRAHGLFKMIENTIQPEMFQKVVSNFLKKYHFGAAGISEFKNEIEDTFTRAMIEVWTKEKGYPVVNVKKVNDGVFEITQQPYPATLDNRNMKFPLSLSYFTSEHSSKHVYRWTNIDEPGRLQVPETTKWIVFNDDRVAQARVNYTTELWLEIAKALEKDITTFDPLTRIVLLEDAWEFVQNKDLKFEILLDLLSFLVHEDNPKVWEVAYPPLAFLYDNLSGEAFKIFNDKVTKLMAKFYSSIGWRNNPSLTEDPVYKKFLELACNVGIPDCWSQSKEIFEEWMRIEAGVKPILPSFISTAALLQMPDNFSFNALEDALMMDGFDGLSLIGMYFEALLASKDQNVVERAINKMYAVPEKIRLFFQKALPVITVKNHPEFIFTYYVENYSRIKLHLYTLPFTKAIIIYLANLPSYKDELTRLNQSWGERGDIDWDIDRYAYKRVEELAPIISSAIARLEQDK